MRPQDLSRWLLAAARTAQSSRTVSHRLFYVSVTVSCHGSAQNDVHCANLARTYTPHPDTGRDAGQPHSEPVSERYGADTGRRDLMRGLKTSWLSGALSCAKDEPLGSLRRGGFRLTKLTEGGIGGLLSVLSVRTPAIFATAAAALSLQLMTAP